MTIAETNTAEWAQPHERQHMNATDTLTIRLDGQPHTVAAGTTLAALVDALGHAPDAVSTAVNGQFLPRHARAAHLLAADDQVLLFQPIVGG